MFFFDNLIYIITPLVKNFICKVKDNYNSTSFLHTKLPLVHDEYRDG